MASLDKRDAFTTPTIPKILDGEKGWDCVAAQAQPRGLHPARELTDTRRLEMILV